MARVARMAEDTRPSAPSSAELGVVLRHWREKESLSAVPIHLARAADRAATYSNGLQPAEGTPTCEGHRQNTLALLRSSRRTSSRLRLGRKSSDNCMAHASTSRLIACTCGALRTPSSSPTFGRRAFGSSSPSHGPLAPFRSIVDLFTGIKATPAPQLSAPEGGSSQLLRRELQQLERKSQAASGGLFSKFKRGSTAIGGMDYEEAMRRRNSEMEKALERTLGGGRRGVPASGASGMEIRCTTLDDKGELPTLPGPFSCRWLTFRSPLAGVVTTTARQYSKLELCTRYGIQPRDLRKLDSGVPTVVPTILVRRSCIIVSFGASCPPRWSADPLSPPAAHRAPPSSRYHCQRGHPFRLDRVRGQLAQGHLPLPSSGALASSCAPTTIADTILRRQHALKTNTKAAHGLPYEFRSVVNNPLLPAKLTPRFSVHSSLASSRSPQPWRQSSSTSALWCLTYCKSSSLTLVRCSSRSAPPTG